MEEKVEVLRQITENICKILGTYLQGMLTNSTK